jgi:hypothetical protein
MTMLITQTSIEDRGRLATFQLQEFEPIFPWVHFRVVRLDWIRQDPHPRQWRLSWNIDHPGLRLNNGALRLLHPQIHHWALDEIFARYWPNHPLAQIAHSFLNQEW